MLTLYLGLIDVFPVAKAKSNVLVKNLAQIVNVVTSSVASTTAATRSLFLKGTPRPLDMLHS